MKYFSSGNGLLYFGIFLIAVFGIIAFIILKSLKREYIGHLLIPIAFIEITVLFLVISLGYGKRGEVGPAVVPRIWAYGFIALNIYILIKTLTGKEEKDPKPGRLDKVPLFLALSVVYILSVKYIGYYIATFIFIFMGIYLLAYRKYLVMITVAGGWLVLAYIAFYKLSYVPLPVGKLIKAIF